MTATAESRAKAPWKIEDVGGVVFVSRYAIGSDPSKEVRHSVRLCPASGAFFADRFAMAAAIRAIAETQE